MRLTRRVAWSAYTCNVIHVTSAECAIYRKAHCKPKRHPRNRYVGCDKPITCPTEVKSIKRNQRKQITHHTVEMATTMAIKTRTRIAQWNIRTLMERTRLAQVEKEMKRYKIEILGLSEVRWNGCGEMKTTDGSTFLHSGLENGSNYGVGFLMSNEVRKSLLDWNPVSERIITMRIRTRARNLNLVQCYAPTEVADQEAKDAFYESLTATLGELNKGEIVIMMGDFNAQIGNDNSGMEHIMGKHGMGRRTDNGDRLVELCQQNDYVIGGTIFPHKTIHKYTWKSPLNARNQIDHLCISRKWRHSLLDVRTRRGADMHSDHELLTADVQLKVAAIRRISNGNRNRKFNIAKLKDPATRRAYTDKLGELTGTSGWQEAHRKAAEETLGIQQRRPSKQWISDDTWRLIEERRALKLQLNHAHTPDLRSSYAEKNKQVKKAARRDKRRFMNTFASEAEAAAERYDMRTLYRKVRTMSNKGHNRNQPIKDKNGNSLVTEDQQMARWKEHFDELLNFDSIDVENGAAEVDDNAAQGANNTIRTAPPSKTEIVEAIRKLKNNKAAGTDGIPAELFLANPTVSAAALHPHIIEAWNAETFESDWKKGVIVKLPKKGDLRQCNNWRGITILNVINKIMAHIIHGRIINHLESTLRDEQAGFRANRGCIDQSNTIRLIVEQSLEYQSPLYMVFVDFEKAFDRIDREAIWRTLAKRNIPAKIVRLIRALYDNASCSVLHCGKLSDEFSVKSGVRQGCILSPLLFITVLDEVLRETVQQGQQGIWWTLTKKLDDLDFADDVCLLSNSISDIQAKLRRLYSAGLKRGLKINIGKTKLMRINTNNSTPVEINGTPIEEVSEFCYLGSMISTDGGTATDIQSRITKARAAYGGLSSVWNADTLTIRTKMRIFNACVLSVLLYGSETWRIVGSEITKAQIFVNRCLRRILRIFWPNRISNEELHARAEHEPLEAVIKRRKWRWIGHTLRKPQTSVTRIALDWNPQGKRRQGRPRNTWRRTVENELGKAGATWNEAKSTAANRVRWRTFSAALCSHRR